VAIYDSTIETTIDRDIAMIKRYVCDRCSFALDDFGIRFSDSLRESMKPGINDDLISNMKIISRYASTVRLEAPIIELPVAGMMMSNGRKGVCTKSNPPSETTLVIAIIVI